MEKNSIWKKDDRFIRVLEVEEERILVIDCVNLTMPVWIEKKKMEGFDSALLKEVSHITGIFPVDIKELDRESLCMAQKRFTMIAGVLPFAGEERKRSQVIAEMAELYHVSRQTVRKYLCLYLVYQDSTVFAVRKKDREKKLTEDEKNMRWSLNKYYYSQKKNSLKTAYIMMLKEKYCDNEEKLMKKYPSYYQFRYFYRKTRNMQNYYISRDGLKNYQRNHRPLTGDHVQDFASHVGVGMLDATVCDIYLVNEAGCLVGRPILTVCIDAFSGLCCGYMLSWEGGVYSLRGLMLHVLSDKKEWCGRFGIAVGESEWNVSELPGTLVTDMGSEYKSENFEQITEVGITLINLASYRPELKGPVEKFFDLIQSYYKPYLKGKGVIEEDYQERGAHDYRKDACLTMEQFEKIILHCIIYYNTKRVVSNYPYTQNMIKEKIRPYACDIWNYGREQISADLINISKEQLILTLLPRTEGEFTRYGLKVNKMRYKNDDYIEAFLSGGKAFVAYNPDDVSKVWLVEKQNFVMFELIEARFSDKTLDEVKQMQMEKNELIKETERENLQAQIELAGHIKTIAGEGSKKSGAAGIKEIRKTRKQEQKKAHQNYMEGEK